MVTRACAWVGHAAMHGGRGVRALAERLHRARHAWAVWCAAAAAVARSSKGRREQPCTGGGRSQQLGIISSLIYDLQVSARRRHPSCLPALVALSFAAAVAASASTASSRPSPAPSTPRPMRCSLEARICREHATGGCVRQHLFLDLPMAGGYLHCSSHHCDFGI